MNLLAIETSASACSIALQYQDRMVVSHEIAPMQQAQIILTRIDELCRQAGMRLNDLDAIAYGCGPGSFTGTRIACSVAQGLSFACSKPIIQVSSLAVMAQTAHDEQGWDHVMVAVDARMDQIYWAVYTVGQSDIMHLSGAEIICFPDAVPTFASENGYGIGDGWLKYEDKIKISLGFNPIAIDPHVIPHAKDLLKMAVIKYKQKEWITAAEAAPVYLR